MVDKNSAPAFSLGTSKRSPPKDNGIPGPGQYTSITSLQSPKANKKYHLSKYLVSVKKNDLAAMKH